MLIGQRLKELREAKDLSQGDIEKVTGLLRCYVSRVENGHTIPSIETLEKWARALNMPLYQVMYEGEGPPKPPKIISRNEEKLWGNAHRDASKLNLLRHCLARINDKERKVLLAVAARIARRSRTK